MKKLIFIFCLSVLLFTLVSAAAPFQTGTNGYDIKVPPIDTLKQNQDFNLNFHVFNISNGVPIGNSSTACVLHLYIPNGTQIWQGIVPHDIDPTVNNEWEINILGANFSYLGENAYNIQCNSTVLGGFASVPIQVTPVGYVFSTSSSLIYVTLLFILLLFNFFFFYIIFSLSLQNERDESTGEIMGINLKKYIKIALIGISYGLILLTLNLMVALSESIQQISQFSGIIGSIFSVMLSLSWVWTLAIIIWIIFNVINDFKVWKYLKRMVDEVEMGR